MATGYRWDETSDRAIGDLLSPAQRGRLGPEPWGEFPDQASDLHALSARLGVTFVAEHQAAWAHAGDLGRRAFETCFDWLTAFAEDLAE
jgi:hypothetical protein